MSWLTDLIAKYLPKPAGTEHLVPVTGHPADQNPLTAFDIDPEGWLRGPGVVHVPSARTSRLTSPRNEPLGIVWHYTATDAGTAPALVNRIIKRPGPNDRAASWHLLLAQDGKVYQSVSFKRGSWHCKEGRIGAHKINFCTVGIEMEGHGNPMDFTPALIDNAIGVLQALGLEYSLHPEHVTLQHGDLDPARRTDAGPHFAHHVLPAIMEKALGIRQLLPGEKEDPDRVDTARHRTPLPPV